MNKKIVMKTEIVDGNLNCVIEWKNLGDIRKLVDILVETFELSVNTSHHEEVTLVQSPPADEVIILDIVEQDIVEQDEEKKSSVFPLENKDDFHKILQRWGIAEKSFKNYNFFYNEKLYELFDDPQELIKYFEEKIKDTTITSYNVGNLMNSFVILWKFQQEKPFISRNEKNKLFDIHGKLKEMKKKLTQKTE